MAAENKADKTVGVYTDAVRWFAAAHLLRETGKARWEQVEADDVRRWMVHLLGEYSDAYAYQQFRSLRQFCRWLAAEDKVADPMAGLRPPKVAEKPVPHFSSEELSRIERTCRGNSFEDRRDAAILAVLLATGIRLAEAAARPDPVVLRDVADRVRAACSAALRDATDAAAAGEPFA